MGGHLPMAAGPPSVTKEVLDRVFIEAPHGRKSTGNVSTVGATDGDAEKAGGVPSVCSACRPAGGGICKRACDHLRSFLGAATSCGAKVWETPQELQGVGVGGCCQDANNHGLIAEGKSNNEQGKLVDQGTERIFPASKQCRKGSPEIHKFNRPGMPRLSIAARVAVAA